MFKFQCFNYQQKLVVLCMDILFLSNKIKQEFNEENIKYGFFFINLV